MALCGLVWGMGLSPARGAASQPAAELLLPAETMVMLTVKDWSDATNRFWQSAIGKLWNDDAMRPTREKFDLRFTNEISARLEKETGIKLADYLDLLKGQLTFALTKATTDGKSMGFVLIADVEDKSDGLKAKLEEARKKWTDTGKPIKTEKFRDVEFSSFEFTQAALQKAARAASGGRPDDIAHDPETEKTKVNVLVAHSQSLLLIGTQSRDLEKILARQGDGNVPSLSEQPAFQASYNSVFRDATAFAWLDFKPIYEQMTKPSVEPPMPPGMGSAGPNLKVEKILPALGLADLKSIAAKVALKPEGIEGQLFLSVPENARQGLLKILAPPAKDASPPPFVPADAVKFQRTRIDFAQAWSLIESALIKIDPSVAGLVQLMLNAAGKDKDPNFDLRKSLVESLGDDYIAYEKAAKGTNEPASLKLLGARNPEVLMNVVKVLMRMAPEPIGTAALKEREFLGKKIYSISIAPGAQGSLHLAPVAGYLAYSDDAAILEEFIRSPDAPPKALRDLPGFADAAQKVGGQNTGWYSFENQVETMRAAFEEAKKQAGKGPGAGVAISLNPLSDETQRLKEWIDTASLPPFDRVAKYFHYYVMAGASTPDGISFKISAPTPPEIK